eukprot:2808040-Rhodomonas_salina.3
MRWLSAQHRNVLVKAHDSNLVQVSSSARIQLGRRGACVCRGALVERNELRGIVFSTLGDVASWLQQRACKKYTKDSAGAARLG